MCLKRKERLAVGHSGERETNGRVATSVQMQVKQGQKVHERTVRAHSRLPCSPKKEMRQKRDMGEKGKARMAKRPRELVKVWGRRDADWTTGRSN